MLQDTRTKWQFGVRHVYRNCKGNDTAQIWTVLPLGHFIPFWSVIIIEASNLNPPI